jgi:hypothetical protein
MMKVDASERREAIEHALRRSKDVVALIYPKEDDVHVETYSCGSAEWNVRWYFLVREIHPKNLPWIPWLLSWLVPSIRRVHLIRIGIFPSDNNSEHIQVSYTPQRLSPLVESEFTGVLRMNDEPVFIQGA